MQMPCLPAWGLTVDERMMGSITRSPSRVLVLTTGTFGNVLRFLPPLTISDDLLGEAFDVIEEGLAAALA